MFGFSFYIGFKPYKITEMGDDHSNLLELMVSTGRHVVIALLTKCNVNNFLKYFCSLYANCGYLEPQKSSLFFFSGLFNFTEPTFSEHGTLTVITNNGQRN